MPRQSEFGSIWWAKRWISAIERVVDPGRLGRGRSYARGGHVSAIDVGPGLIRARVMGSRPQPYRVQIRLNVISPTEWDKVLDQLASQALFAAKLLAGEMPPTVDEAFAAAGVALFPATASDLQTECSCPDWANPCKHVAAVHYLLGAEFDSDPFLLFKLRGRTKDEVVVALRTRRAAAASAESPAAPLPAPVEAPVAALDAELERFWQAGEALGQIQIRIAPLEVPASVIKRLGPPDLPATARTGPIGERELLRTLTHAYAVISAKALALAYGDKESDPDRVPITNPNRTA
jgi:uncharacterized Zn finger protein